MTLGKVTMKEMDQNANSLTELIGYVNYNVNEAGEGIETDNDKLDKYARAVVSLTLNTYVDSEISYTYSLEEILENY